MAEPVRHPHALERGGHDNITIIAARWEGESFDDEAHETPVISSPRTLTPTPAPASSGRDVTWDDIDPNTLASAADVEDPDQSTEDSPIQAPPPPRAPTDDEQPRTGLAIAIAVGAVLLIVIAFLAAQGLFG